MKSRYKSKHDHETTDLRQDEDFRALVEDLKKKSSDDRDRLQDWLTREMEKEGTDEIDK
jgi:hypothetical protein